MSAPPKPRGSTGPLPELTKLKLLWRDSLSESARDFWLSRFASADTQAVLRAELLAKLKIKLTRDAQLTDFRSWLEDQRLRDDEAERQQIEETQLREQHPDWDEERLRSEVIAGSLRRALVSGDFKGLGMKAVKAGQQEKIILLDTEKFKEGLRTKLESGLEQLAGHIKGNAKAQAAYEAFRATIAETTK